MFSFSRLGVHGNLGNQLFEIASVIGLAEKHGVNYIFPEWQYAKYFREQIPQAKDISFDIRVDEPHYHYADWILDTGRRVDILGWLQTEKYWLHCEDKVRSTFKFEEKFYKSLKNKYKSLFKKETVAISVRRGDYVNNENYHQLGLDYYLGAAAMFPDANILVFSDDFEYCRHNLPESFHLMTGNGAIEQLALGSMCDHFIIANSSFSWWMAYLGEKNKSKVIAPAFWNAGPLLKHSDDKDVVPARWIRYNPALKTPEQKIDLMDVTFTIPIKYDHEDRKQNLQLNIDYLRNYFNTNIIVGESDNIPRFNGLVGDCQYVFFPIGKSFHRTQMLNEMAKMAKTEIVVNWDCDVFINPIQIFLAAERIRSGEASGVYPYDGRFFRCKREIFYDEFRKSLSMDVFRGKSFPESQWKILSYGGAVMWNKKDFIKGGMENEFMIHYGPEDFERYDRFKKLGFNVERIKGPLFHMDHFTGNNGSNGHKHMKLNEEEYKKIRAMNAEKLRAYVETWPWTKNVQPAPIIKDKKRPAPCPLITLNFDRIYCLNLARREDRKQYAQMQLSEIGLHDVHFFPAVDGKEQKLMHWDQRITPGMIGCYESHKLMLKDALDNNFETICVFEDDIKPIDGFNLFLDRALPMIPNDWEFAYLGCTEYGGLESYKKKINNFWVIPKCAWGTQGYMIRGRKAIQRIYDLICKPQERQIDEELANHTLPESGLKYYAIFPSVVEQAYEEMGSDVQKFDPKKKKMIL